MFRIDIENVAVQLNVHNITVYGIGYPKESKKKSKM